MSSVFNILALVLMSFSVKVEPANLAVMHVPFFVINSEALCNVLQQHFMYLELRDRAQGVYLLL